MPAAERDLRAVARSLTVDRATAEVVVALRESGVRSIVLRGPALVRRLYEPGVPRPYVDVDLLVPPGGVGAAEPVLERFGFELLVGDRDLHGHRPLHAHEWTRRRDHVSVDVHRTLSGVGAPPSELWGLIAGEAVTQIVAGVEIEVPSDAGLAFVVSLHAAHHSFLRPKTLRDLERAVERLPRETWSRAVELATCADAVPAFAAGLRLVPAGSRLADALALPRDRTVEVALRAWAAPPLALGLDWLTRTPGVRPRARLVVRTVAPSPGALRLWRPLARRGRRGLVGAYVSHPFWLTWHVVPSAIALRRARKGEM